MLCGKCVGCHDSFLTERQDKVNKADWRAFAAMEGKAKLFKTISLLGSSFGFNKGSHASTIKVSIFPNAEISHEAQRR